MATPKKAAAKKKSTTPIVKSVNNRYKVSGNFHRIIPNTPIFNEKKKLCGVTNPREMTYIHSYGGEAIFFESLAKGKLMGAQCVNPDCEFPNTIWIPYRSCCADCLTKNVPVDITKMTQETAVVHSFMVTERTGAFNTLDIPIKFINVEFGDPNIDTILMGYLSYGEPEIGMRVLPIFNKKNPTYTITDLSWVPEGTPKSKLPKDFSF